MAKKAAETLKALKPARMRTAHWFGLLLLGLVLLLALATRVWWGAIRESLMDPGVSYQTYTPPAAPDYSDESAWALWPDGEDAGEADVFFIHPTTYQGRQWNAPLDDAAADRRLQELMLPNYAAPFDGVGRVYAPRYRQANLYTQMTLREDAREARAFPYRDIRAAFEAYLAEGSDAPLIIVGVEQGGLLAARLIDEVIAPDPELKARLAAAYLIETAVPASRYSGGAALPACTARAQAGCVVAWLADAPDEAWITAERLRHAPVWSGTRLSPLRDEALLCVNPLLGARSDAAADTDANIGAANASGLEWGQQPGFQAHQVSAQCVDGLLEVSRPRSPGLRGREGWADSQRVRPYNWFYADLAEDAAARVGAML